MAYVDVQGTRDHILIVLLYCLDYGKVSSEIGRCREFLQYCLENGSRDLIKAGLELLRLLYRSELQDFSSWGIDLLVTKLSISKDEEILSNVLDVIEEVTQEDQENMEMFLEKWPKL